MKLFKTKTRGPITNETKDIETIKIWVVSWQSRYGEFSGDCKKEFVGFLSKEEAEEFADSLRNAFKLIRHTSGCKVKVTWQSD